MCLQVQIGFAQMMRWLVGRADAGRVPYGTSLRSHRL